MYTPTSWVQNSWVRDWIQWSWFSGFLQGGRIGGGSSSFEAWSCLSQWWGQRWAETSWTHGLILCSASWALVPFLCLSEGRPWGSVTGALTRSSHKALHLFLPQSIFWNWPLSHEMPARTWGCSSWGWRGLGSWSDGPGQCWSLGTPGVPGHRIKWLHPP